ncbi:hypothetical protein [Oceaniglobus roseus]|uniref:hypothetical protein n=1 Tax=Oceaniglobus roseus TaxID=1737570 RepID=UPI0012FFD82B|nr:hypothetical protein [Kandeliimicrobium roseum]
MDDRHKRLASRGAAETGPATARDEILGRLAGGEAWRLGSIEWLLDWIEQRPEAPR